jgi:energy-coupling factor transporter ATP-binding protein EcfA2
MQNPFTTTFSKSPEYTYISTNKTEEILENFSYDMPSESVYKITGVRGSGKTVILAKVEENLRSEENKEKGWLVFDLNPARDMLGQMAAMLHKEGFGKSETKSKSMNISATVLGTGGGLGYSIGKDNNFFDIGVAIEEMLQSVQKKGKKILIGIDEVSKTIDMVKFTLEYGKWLRAGYPVYLVCTGLYENIQEVSNVKNLTFFRRATTIKTEPLNAVRMAEMYKRKLNIDGDEAKKMAKLTKGYAYAFQELGVLYFKKDNDDTLDDIEPALKSELFAYSYEKIWEELTEADRYLVRLLVDKDEYKREEVLNLMGDKSGNYSMYRDRLIKRGLLDSRQAYISLSLPFFAEYIKEYCI